MKYLHVNTLQDYTIFIGQAILDKLTASCVSLKKRFAIITDDNLYERYGVKLRDAFLAKNIPVELFSFKAGEAYKTRETKQYLEDRLLEQHFGRDTCLIALGGGVVTDVVGFLASTYCRGVPVIYVPTTLLAMVDASVGGKTAINTPHGKNLIGTFTQPQSVWIDTDFLKSLPESEWLNGLTEMLKHGLIADRAIFTSVKNQLPIIREANANLIEEMIYASCAIKRNIIEQDEREQGMRQLLNFGHTIGHAIETLADYQIGHGSAVAMGILVESYIARQLNLQSESTFNEIYTVFTQYDLTTSVFTRREDFQSLLMLDKKAIAKTPHFILLKEIGEPLTREKQYSFPIENNILNQALDWAEKEFSC